MWASRDLHVEASRSIVTSLADQRVARSSPQAQHRSLVEMLRERAAAHPGRPALYSGEAQTTYGQLEEITDRVAVGLQTVGIKHGERVGLQVQRGLPAVVGIIGILKAGACYVPLDAAYPSARLEFICQDAGVEHVVCDSHAKSLAAARIDLSALTQSPRTPATAAGPGPDDPAYVIYTSGSTGQPKGVVVTHANVLALLAGALPLFDLGANDRWTLFHSYNFDFSVWELWGALATGGSAVAVPADVAISPDRFAKLLEDNTVTILCQVPSVFSHVAAALTRHAATSLALRYVVFGGEALHRASVRQVVTSNIVPDVRWVNMYGITETTVHVTFKELAPDDIAGEGPTPIGRPLPHLGVLLLDENQRRCNGEDPGELWIYGGGVAAGYLNRPELTSQRFSNFLISGQGQRCYRSGDLARRRADGELEYLGRVDDQVKLRGFRIELGEVEAAVRDHPAISHASVVKVDAPTGAILVAVVVATEPSEAVDASDLRAFLTARLPAHLLPNRVATVDSLPLAPSGKVDRRAVVALAEV